MKNKIINGLIIFGLIIFILLYITDIIIDAFNIRFIFDPSKFFKEVI